MSLTRSSKYGSIVLGCLLPGIISINIRDSKLAQMWLGNLILSTLLATYYITGPFL